MLRSNLLMMLLIMSAGCAGSSPSLVQQPAVDSARQSELCVQSPDMKKPFMFGEAKLPSEFPPPGPVGEILIKKYPPARAAVVLAGSKRDQDDLFMPLFNHIKSHQIAMSSPVEMTYSTAGAVSEPLSMAFYYSDTTIGQTGKDGSIDVIDVPAAEYVSIGVRGSYDAAHFQTALSQLHGWLQTHSQFSVIGLPRYLAYNSPFVPFFLRFGEVQLPVTGK